MTSIYRHSPIQKRNEQCRPLTECSWTTRPMCRQGWSHRPPKHSACLAALCQSPAFAFTYAECIFNAWSTSNNQTAWALGGIGKRRTPNAAMSCNETMMTSLNCKFIISKTEPTHIVDNTGVLPLKVVLKRMLIRCKPWAARRMARRSPPALAWVAAWQVIPLRCQCQRRRAYN